MKNQDQSAVLELAAACRKSRVLLTAVEVGIFDAVGSLTKTSPEIADELGLNPRAVDRLMNALCSLGMLEKRDNLFSNTQVSRDVLCRDGSAYFSGMGHAIFLWNSWSRLTDVVRNGGGGMQDGAGRDEEWNRSFIAAMEAFGRMRAPQVVDMLDLSGSKRVLDVGGGSGAYAVEIAGRKSDISVVVFDLPDVTPLTKEYLSKSEFSGRVTTVDGDYIRDELPGGFDLVLLSNIIHSLGPDGIEELFRKSFRAILPGGQLVIQEFLVDEDRSGPLTSTLFALNMLVNTGEGDTYTESEVRSMLESAGFAGVLRRDTPVDTSLITALKP